MKRVGGESIALVILSRGRTPNPILPEIEPVGMGHAGVYTWTTLRRYTYLIPMARSFALAGGQAEMRICRTRIADRQPAPHTGWCRSRLLSHEFTSLSTVLTL